MNEEDQVIVAWLRGQGKTAAASFSLAWPAGAAPPASGWRRAGRTCKH